MRIGDIVTDRWTGKPMKIVEFLNKDGSLLLVNYNNDREMTVLKEDIE